MTAQVPTPRPAARVSLLSVIAFVGGVVALLPMILIYLGALLPNMDALGWLLIVVFPFAILVGSVTVILGIISVILDVRAGRRRRWSVIGLVLGVVAVLVPVALLGGWFV